MRVVLQRVRGARAVLDDTEVARIGGGLVAFVGFGRGDDPEVVARMAHKVAHLRIFERGDSKFGASVLEAAGEILTISQFTLYGDCGRGRRPDFSHAAAPDLARGLYAAFAERLRGEGVEHVAQGPFQSRLTASLDNWGPFTIMLDSEDLWKD